MILMNGCHNTTVQKEDTVHCLQHVITYLQINKVQEKSEEPGPAAPSVEPLLPACTAALSYTTVVWENFCAVLNISKTHLPLSCLSLLPMKPGFRSDKKAGSVLWRELYLTCNWLRVGLLAMVSSAELKLKLI